MGHVPSSLQPASCTLGCHQLPHLAAGLPRASVTLQALPPACAAERQPPAGGEQGGGGALRGGGPRRRALRGGRQAGGAHQVRCACGSRAPRTVEAAGSAALRLLWPRGGAGPATELCCLPPGRPGNPCVYSVRAALLAALLQSVAWRPEHGAYHRRRRGRGCGHRRARGAVGCRRCGVEAAERLALRHSAERAVLQRPLHEHAAAARAPTSRCPPAAPRPRRSARSRCPPGAPACSSAATGCGMRCSPRRRRTTAAT